MSDQNVAAATQRAQAALSRRPTMGDHEDAPAVSRWRGDLACSVTHPSGACAHTDIPAELGGGGQHTTPGWLFRAGLAACASTSIAMFAAAAGLALTDLEVEARSRSDTRGLLGMSGPDGVLVSAASYDLQLLVRIAATGMAQDTLEELVKRALSHSPIPSVVRCGAPIELKIDIG